MKVVNLDLSLKEQPSHYPRDKSHAQRKFFSDGAIRYDYKNGGTTHKEQIVYSTTPDTADLYHSNYLDYLQNTYADHYKFVISPQTFWYTLMSEIAVAVTTDPKKYEVLFTRKPGEKQRIIVECEGYSDPLDMQAIYEQMKGLVPLNTELFLPQFTTSDTESNAATLGAFLETCSPYYEYGMMLACGHPAVRIDGSKDDWEMLRANIKDIASLIDYADRKIPNHIRDTVLPIVNNIIQVVSGADKTTWLKEIFTQQRCGSGSQYFVDGWFTKMFVNMPKQPEVHNFAAHVSKVPYTIAGAPDTFKMVFGLTHSIKDKDGFMVPQFSHGQIRVLKTPVFVPAEKKELTDTPFKLEKVKVVANSRAIKSEWMFEPTEELEVITGSFKLEPKNE